MGVLAVLLLSKTAQANDDHFPLKVNGIEMSRGGFHALLRQNSGRLALIRIHLHHTGLEYTPTRESLNLTTRTTKADLEQMARRALELRAILEAYFHPQVGQVKLEGTALVARLEAYTQSNTVARSAVTNTPTASTADTRFPLTVEGLMMTKTDFHRLLAQNSWWLHYESAFVQDDTFEPTFTDLALRPDTSADALVDLATNGLWLRSIIVRFEEYRTSMPVDRLRAVLIAYRQKDEASLKAFLQEYPVKPEALSLH